MIDNQLPYHDTNPKIIGQMASKTWVGGDRGLKSTSAGISRYCKVNSLGEGRKLGIKIPSDKGF